MLLPMFEKWHSLGWGSINPWPRIIATVNLTLLSLLFNLPKRAVSDALHRKGLKASNTNDVVSFITYMRWK